MRLIDLSPAQQQQAEDIAELESRQLQWARAGAKGPKPRPFESATSEQDKRRNVISAAKDNLALMKSLDLSPAQQANLAAYEKKIQAVSNKTRLAAAERERQLVTLYREQENHLSRSLSRTQRTALYALRQQRRNAQREEAERRRQDANRKDEERVRQVMLNSQKRDREAAARPRAASPPPRDYQADLKRIETFHTEEVARLTACKLTPAQRAVITTHEEQARVIKQNARLSLEERYQQLSRIYTDEQWKTMQLMTTAQREYRDHLFRLRYAKGAAQARKLREASDKQAKERVRQEQAIHAEALAQFRALLTPEQQQSFDKFRALHVRWQRRR